MLPDDTSTPGAPAGKIERIALKATNILRSAMSGGFLGGVGGMVTLPFDKTGYAMGISAVGGSLVGVLGGVSRVVVDHRRAMIEAASGEDRQAKVEAERQLRTCQAENERLERVVAEQDHRIRTLETSVEVERKRTDSLTQMVVELSERLNEVEPDRRARGK